MLSNTEDMRDLRRVFRELDVNEDGAINLEEFKDGLPRLATVMSNLDESNVETIF